MNFLATLAQYICLFYSLVMNGLTRPGLEWENI